MSPVPEMLRSIAEDWFLLPAYLPADTAPSMDSMGRTRTKVHAPLPLRPEVSDLIRMVEKAAADWEGSLRASYQMGDVYWTKPRNVAVPESLNWSAGIIARPPLVRHGDGVERPFVLSTEVAMRIESEAAHLSAKTSRTVARVVLAPTRLVCPLCACPTLFFDPLSRRSRCIRCGTEARPEA